MGSCISSKPTISERLIILDNREEKICKKERELRKIERELNKREINIKRKEKYLDIELSPNKK